MDCALHGWSWIGLDLTLNMFSFHSSIVNIALGLILESLEYRSLGLEWR